MGAIPSVRQQSQQLVFPSTAPLAVIPLIPSEGDRPTQPMQTIDKPTANSSISDQGATDRTRPHESLILTTARHVSQETEVHRECPVFQRRLVAVVATLSRMFFV